MFGFFKPRVGDASLVEPLQDPDSVYSARPFFIHSDGDVRYEVLVKREDKLINLTRVQCLTLADTRKALHEMRAEERRTQ